MDTAHFWQLVEQAREGAGDDQEVVSRATALLAARMPADIVTAQQVLWDLMAASYRAPLWAAAYLINGGCSDDAFEYFRGWLMAQGRAVFERAVLDPDSLADLPAIREAAAEELDIDCEEMLSIAYCAHLTATGEQLPPDCFTIRYPGLDLDWDFDDRTEMTRRLPRLAALYPR
ncbi:DUF4240 domain-containing protein [Nonomuraea sp. NPDC050404]|uniref:DUF4240 domain-containing protein n=1 Tax=Nonomuraea sp. NPDC050404 TaxID=3155783 RepID=UPI00341162B7